MTSGFSSVQLPGNIWLFETPWTAACQTSLSITNSLSLLKLMSIELVMPSNHLMLCRPPLGGQSIWVSSSVLSMNIQDWFPLGLTGLIYFQSKRLLSLLQHHSLKTSILWCSAFFIVQLSHPYMTTGKTIALTRWNFVGKIMSLLFNIGHLNFPLCFFTSYLYIFFMLKGGCSEFEPGKNSYPMPPCLHLIKKC